ncbi:sulfurtransferase [uncultured Aquimonas sp.]|uniref:sulfurtransferase n=1 Tax=uncultured Aquimonas sp. TaxID=385483 RepID=UPI00086AFEAB|nr:sulfurtransferase [uncultured Aquimonas sp.]ODU43518.1 MAG: sulfurtransferase [Xanthomonadaceae bacterium SCN 69-123]
MTREVLNIAAYHFADIAEPAALRELLRARCEAAGLKGSVLVAPEGLNLFLAGAESAVERVLDFVRAQPGFEGLRVKRSWSAHVPFARLKVKLKKEIIAFGHDACVPRSRRAPVVSPAQLRAWIARGSDDSGRPLVLVDTRNREELAYGHFENAVQLPIDNFTELTAALAPLRPEMAGATVVSYCTGGIRCEKAALWMQDAGFANVFQLDGGILDYFEQVGGEGWQGECFVFDARVALKPDLSPRVDAPVPEPVDPLAARKRAA